MTRVNFEIRAGILEAGCPETDREWCWYRGDREIVISHSGEIAGALTVPEGATVAEVKRLIRQHAKGVGMG